MLERMSAGSHGQLPAWCLAALALVASAPAVPPPVGVEHVEIEFVTPEHWLCVHARPCIECRNVSAVASEVIVREPGEPPRRHRVDAGTRLAVCEPEDRLAGAAGRDSASPPGAL